MSLERNQAASCRSIAAGIGALVAVLAAAALVLSDVVKTVGWLLLLVPHLLGLVQVAGPTEVHTSSPYVAQEIELVQPGPYLIHYDFPLNLFDILGGRYSSPAVDLTSQDSGKAVVLWTVDRGLMPYDTPFARGRPVYALTITTPGVYVLNSHDRSVSIVPDYASGRERVITRAYLVQLGAIALALGIVFLPRYGRRWRRHAEQRRRAVARADVMRDILRSGEQVAGKK